MPKFIDAYQFYDEQDGLTEPIKIEVSQIIAIEQRTETVSEVSVKNRTGLREHVLFYVEATPDETVDLIKYA